ncbi:hypothetical protein GCM10007049_26170 [Echinicola pacifica]|uniref:M23ase beta-sheet core domain-containing protein n=1 Tax=Echinicola pacifica TaxID=346377 RepID=A0A918USX5_9BACT|nr:M23 family metallopeptidase [Echinicola pacifica]GGZ31682.1 hypothetical protein GCM10007049_26170 [Echinicola pacifica]
MKLNRLALLLPIFLLSLTAAAQIEKGYYKFPIKPGQRNYLSGNMSEIRPNHFHTGIDIKTDGREGLPVYAAADGYVYRMKVSSFGYGNVLYLRHPNGQYTLYGHLKDFNSQIEDYMWAQMQKAEDNNLEIYPDSLALPVRKGDIIAYSGNTGSSGGPHLHFEIRDSKDRALDPLKFGFREIEDSTPPTLRSIAITPLTIDSRINGKFERTVLQPAFRGNQFVIDGNVEITGKVGIEISAYDKLDGVYNQNGFPHFEVFQEGIKTFDVNVDRVDFNIGRFLLTHTHQNRYTKLYTTAYNQFDFYSPDSLYSGAIEVAADSSKAVTVRLEDVYGNTSNLEMTFKGEPVQHEISGYSASKKTLDYEDNWLIVRAQKLDSQNLATFYIDDLMMEVMMSYEDPRFRTYIWDMDYGIPDSIDVCNEILYPKVQQKIPFGKEYYYSDNNCTINFEKESLLETIFLNIESGRYNSRPSLEINEGREDYLREEIEVSMDVTDYKGSREKVHIYQHYSNGYKRFVGGEWNDGKITFKTKNFGTFVLVQDDTAPSISPIRVNSSELRFSIRDNLSGIKSFEARVDGKWVIMRYEHKNGVIWSQKTDAGPFKGKLELKLTDNAGNISVFTRNL